MWPKVTRGDRDRDLAGEKSQESLREEKYSISRVSGPCQETKQDLGTPQAWRGGGWLRAAGYPWGWPLWGPPDRRAGEGPGLLSFMKHAFLS